MLGWHGIRRSLDEPALIRTELTATTAWWRAHLSVCDASVCHISRKDIMSKQICRQDFSKLEEKIGIMVETPSAVMIIEDIYNEVISFVSFGTNDLTHLVLGIDRNNERWAKLSSVYHPAVLQCIKMVIDVCNRFEVETSICGESGSQSEMAQILVRYGIKSISCNRDAIETISTTVFEEEQRLDKTKEKVG